MQFAQTILSFGFERQSKKLELYKYISPENIILSNRIGVSKKNESLQMFKALSDVLFFEDRECLFIDDRSENIKMSIRYGFTSLYYPRGYCDGSEYLKRLLVQMGILK